MTRFQLGSREMIQQEGFSEREPGGVLVAIRVHALALQVPVSAQVATNIIDGDTIDIDGVRIRIVQIDTPETFGPRCENELILGRKAKKRLRELLDSGTVPRKHHGGFRTCLEDVARRHHRHHLQAVLTTGLVWG